MTRTFTQKHYVTVADAIIEAYQRADVNPSTSVLTAHGIDLARHVLSEAFARDSAKFDLDKFNRYIEAFLHPVQLEQVTREPEVETECGRRWKSLPSSCYRCNEDGGHYHYANGECDTEPCVRHGGPQ